MSLVVTDFLLCGWPIVGANFSEWVQIFQKKFVPGGTNFRMVQIKHDSTLASLHRQCVGIFIAPS